MTSATNFNAAGKTLPAGMGSPRGTPRTTFGLDRWPGHGGYTAPSRQELH